MHLQYHLSFLLLTAVVTFADDLIAGNTSLANDPAGKPESIQATNDTKKKTTTEKPTTTTEITTTSTLDPKTTPTTATPATNSTTVNPPTTPSTHPTSTTTVKPPTTPSTHPTSTTTVKPPTTTTPATTVSPPTPSPSPKPADEWIVKDKNGTVCIIANMLLKITVPYKSANKTVNVEFNLNNVGNATATGECGIDVQTLTLAWENITSTFTFGHSKDNSSYFLSSIEVNILVNNHTFPNNTMVNASKISFKKQDDAQVFTVPKNHSYTCANVKPINLNGTVFNATIPLNVTVPGTLTVSKVHVEAFGIGRDTKYSAPMDCATVETPDIVPIVVGLVLAGLVVVVLIAYLVGRRRAQARGYLSM